MNEKLTLRQYSILLVNSFIGLGILSLASETAKTASHNNYIAVFIAGLISNALTLSINSYIFSKTSLTFIDLLEKLYGKFLYLVVYFTFLIDFFIVECLVISGYCNILHTTISSFINTWILILLVVIIATITSINKISTLGRLSEINSITLISLFILPIIYLPKLEFMNIEPFANNPMAIISALPSCILAYQGGEHSYFFANSIEDRKKLSKVNMLCSLYIIATYVIITFSSTGYMGAELISKIKYSLILLVELINLPMIGDLKAFFLVIWSASILITVSSNGYLIRISIKNLLSIKNKFINILFDIILFILTFTFSIILNYYPKAYSFTTKIAFPFFYTSVLIFCLITLILFLFKRRSLYD